MQQIRLAAQYIRMSTDRQDLSPVYQMAAIERYAKANGMHVVQTYCDEGKSGITIRKRPQLQALIRDVAADDCQFTAVLVYDVSRWGRFQNTDESAYYDFHCRLHGVEVIYVAEPFVDDAGPLAALAKTLKRAMAAEYSRDLAVKVRAGQAHVFALGYQMGSLPPLGYRRQAYSKDGIPKQILETNERKSMQSDRIRWVPGPDWEVELVRVIFRSYAEHRPTIKGLTHGLNDVGYRTRLGSKFTVEKVRKMLSDDTYIGNHTWGRSITLNSSTRRAPPERVVKQFGTIEPIIDKNLWDRVQIARTHENALERHRERHLAKLRRTLQQFPNLTSNEIQAKGCASPDTYVKLFGGFKNIWPLVGRDVATCKKLQVERRQRSRDAALEVRLQLADALWSAGQDAVIDHKNAVMLVNGTRVYVRAVWPERRGAQVISNRMVIHPKISADYALVVRMHRDGTVHDFLVSDFVRVRAAPQRMKEANPQPWIGHVKSVPRLARILVRLARSRP